MRTPRPLLDCAPVALLVAALAVVALPARANVNNRLDRDVRPTFQSIKLKLDPSQPDYSGSVHIDLTVDKTAEAFRFYALDMDVIRVRLSSGASELAIKTEAGDAGQMFVRPEQPLAPGTYGLDVDFQNNFNVRANSLYRVKSGTDWYCFTQFEANAARQAFPCFDEPEFKIPWQVTVTVPATSTAISNTLVDKESSVGGQRTVAFQRTPPLPSYLVAILAGPFEYVPMRGMKVPGRVVTVKGSSRLAAEAARITPGIVAALERYFGRPYPYSKLDLIGVPEFAAGAMENAGAITYREEGLLLDPAGAPLVQRVRLASTTAHELAHMWFGDLVTMQWWDDLWLNESFASWMSEKITNEVFPQYNQTVREMTGRQTAMATDARPSTHAIRQSVDAFANIDRLFDALAYQKGQAVLGMLENWLGPEVFRRGINAYLKENEWKNATAADLWKALSAASGQDVRSVTTTFLDQGGLPLVSLETLPGGKVHLQQKRFLNYGVEVPNPTSWKIPVVLRYSDGRATYTQKVLLGDAEQTVTLERTTAPTWVHPDADERGYYRWTVPAAMLQAIADHADQLTARERVGLLSNASALLDAGLLHGDDFMRLLSQFADDRQPEVVQAVLDGLEKVNVTFVRPATATPFAVTVRKMLRPTLKHYGMEKMRGEPEAVALMRPNLLTTLAIFGREAEILDWGRTTARRFLNNPASVDVSLAGTALNLAARDGSFELFEEYRTRFETAKVPGDRTRFLTALGKFRNAGLVDRALDYALSGPLRPQEVFTIPRALTEDDELRQRQWVWLRSNYRAIVRAIPPYYMPRLPSFADCCREDWMEEVKNFFSMPETNYPGTREELAKVIDSVSDCSGLKEREEQSVTRYLLDPGQGRRMTGVTPSP